MAERTRFKFANNQDRSVVEDDIALAIFTAECVYGRPQTRLQVRYLVADGGASAVLETDGQAGDAVLRVFIGLCSARFGEGGYFVEPVSQAPREQR
jgi:hypothetical protein